MDVLNARNRSVTVYDETMVERSDVPRSAFDQQHSYKTTFDSGLLIPVYCEEVLPGDQVRGSMTAIARLQTPVVPFMDNLHLESFFFFVPYRLLWSNWKKFMGEQVNPSDSISFIVPQVVSPAGGYAIGSLQDYFGLPTVGQITAGATFSHSALPIRAYALIYNEWFRDQNLINSVSIPLGDGPDANGSTLQRRGKRHDYFTGALPWPLKGGVSVPLPLGTSAPVKTSNVDQVTGAQPALAMMSITGLAALGSTLNIGTGSALVGSGRNIGSYTSGAPTGTFAGGYPSNLFADLTVATSATINQFRQSLAIQTLLEKDARGGTRYTEMNLMHFGVRSPDMRQQRPEYLGGGHTMVMVSAIAQTSATGLTGGTAPKGDLSAVATGVANDHDFSGTFDEHGIVIGLVNVRADLTYQQGLRRFWSRQTRYDFYFPVFAHLGEQAILNKEIYATGGVTDDQVFGYTERWNEYRYSPSMITGLMRSTALQTIDVWHAAQRFTSLPTLNQTFIQDVPPLQRIVSVGTGAAGKEFIFDALFDVRFVRPLPMYSTPGLGMRF